MVIKMILNKSNCGSARQRACDQSTLPRSKNHPLFVQGLSLSADRSGALSEKMGCAARTAV
jgi:hypothetical protein